MISLIGSIVKPMESCATSGHSFLQKEFIVSSLMDFTVFFYNSDGISKSIILPDFYDVSSGFSSIEFTVRCKGPYDPLV